MATFACTLEEVVDHVSDGRFSVFATRKEEVVMTIVHEAHKALAQQHADRLRYLLSSDWNVSVSSIGGWASCITVTRDVRVDTEPKP